MGREITTLFFVRLAARGLSL